MNQMIPEIWRLYYFFTEASTRARDRRPVRWGWRDCWVPVGRPPRRRARDHAGETRIESWFRDPARDPYRTPRRDMGRMHWDLVLGRRRGGAPRAARALGIRKCRAMAMVPLTKAQSKQTLEVHALAWRVMTVMSM